MSDYKQLLEDLDMWATVQPDAAKAIRELLAINMELEKVASYSMLKQNDRLKAENARLREALSAVLDDLELRADIRDGERLLDLSHGVLMKAEKALNPTSAGDE